MRLLTSTVGRYTATAHALRPHTARVSRLRPGSHSSPPSSCASNSGGEWPRARHAGITWKFEANGAWVWVRGGCGCAVWVCTILLACMRAHTPAPAHLHLHLHLHPCTRTCTYTCTRTRACTCTCTCTRPLEGFECSSAPISTIGDSEILGRQGSRLAPNISAQTAARAIGSERG